MPSRKGVPPSEIPRARELTRRLREYREHNSPLPGLDAQGREETFVAQIIDSERRVRHIQAVRQTRISETALTGEGSAFDPLRGAMLWQRRGDTDEACWLVFLSAHFARHRRTAWQLTGDFYNRLGDAGQWTWREAANKPESVSDWLRDNAQRLREAGGRFGNHRKYESLNGDGAYGTANVLYTYLNWVGDTHESLFERVVPTGATPEEAFAALYIDMRKVARFGRTGRFDYLTMISKLELLPIRPDSCHLAGATGPQLAAKLLMHGRPTASVAIATLEDESSGLGKALGVTPDILEDAMCNWQKNPSSYVYFAG